MKKTQFIWLITLSVLGVAAYVLVFGDVGFLVQQKLKNRLTLLEENVAGLQKENEILNDRYLQIQESDHKIKTVEYTGRDIVILKFRNSSFDKRQASQKGQSLQNREITLNEARGLYLTGLIFIALLGYVFLGRFLK